MTLAYSGRGAEIARGTPAGTAIVRALQRDLRQLGYLRGGLDGVFGPETEQAVRALRYDLLFNDGAGDDGKGLVGIRDFNRGRVGVVKGVVDEELAACMEELLEDDRVPKLPRSDDAAGDNRCGTRPKRQDES